MEGALIRGHLSFDAHHRWYFEQRAKNDKVLRFALLDDLPFAWESQVHEGSLIPGWQSNQTFLGQAIILATPVVPFLAAPYLHHRIRRRHGLLLS
jgi:hypothetical protein